MQLPAKEFLQKWAYDEIYKISIFIVRLFMLVTLAFSGSYKSDVYADANNNFTSSSVSHSSSTADFDFSVQWENFVHTGTDYAICTIYVRKNGVIETSVDFYYSNGDQEVTVQNVNAFTSQDPSPTVIEHMVSHSTGDDSGYATLGSYWY